MKKILLSLFIATYIIQFHGATIAAVGQLTTPTSASAQQVPTFGFDNYDNNLFLYVAKNSTALSPEHINDTNHDNLTLYDIVSNPPTKTSKPLQSAISALGGLPFSKLPTINSTVFILNGNPAAPLLPFSQNGGIIMMLGKVGSGLICGIRDGKGDRFPSVMAFDQFLVKIQYKNVPYWFGFAYGATPTRLVQAQPLTNLLTPTALASPVVVSAPPIGSIPAYRFTNNSIVIYVFTQDPLSAGLIDGTGNVSSTAQQKNLLGVFTPNQCVIGVKGGSMTYQNFTFDSLRRNITYNNNNKFEQTPVILFFKGSPIATASNCNFTFIDVQNKTYKNWSDLLRAIAPHGFFAQNGSTFTCTGITGGKLVPVQPEVAQPVGTSVASRPNVFFK